MNKVVIYTSLVGHYDELKQPLVIDDNIDYVCFTNDVQDEFIGVWKIINFKLLSSVNAVNSRLPKILPHEYLSEYEYSVWIDSSSQIVNESFYSIIYDKISKGIIFSLPLHPYRNCVYDEIVAAYIWGKITLKELFDEYTFLKKRNIPEHIGLCENGLIFRKHNIPIVMKISSEWWNYYFSRTKRDQFWLCIVFYGFNFIPDIFFSNGVNLRNSKSIVLHSHLNTENRILFYVKKKYRKYIYYIFKLMKIGYGE